jgi:hypothetical protein
VNPMPFQDLEQAYETLAAAIDRAGPANEALFLAKLALVLAHRLGDIESFQTSVTTALAGLPAADLEEEGKQ